jgi:hypothetical protein
MALKLGDRNREVRELASALCMLGYLSPECVNDTFDFNKLESIRMFQRAESLDDTGEVDSATQSAINSALAEMR